jgi:ABC-2 type transport system permease protein
MTVLNHSIAMAGRHLRNLARQPWYIAFTLVQPVIYLLLFGELFRRIVDLPGFGTTSYLAFLTPGIVMQTALFSSGWNGGSVIDDIDRGVMDRFLVSPASRFALVAGRLIQLSVVILIQSLIIIGLGLLRGAEFAGGAQGIILIVISAMLLSVPFGALSCAMALTTRRMESVIAAVNFLLLPLTLLSSIFMARDLMPPWMQIATRLNPVDWAVEVGRGVLMAEADWGFVVIRLAGLTALGLLCAMVAARAFRAYQRDV